MNAEPSATDLHSILAAQQQQIRQLSAMISGLSEAVLASTQLSGRVHDHAVGQAAALQVFAEVLMAASPELKRGVATALGHLQARPDAMPNEHFRDAIDQLHRAATSPSRAADGRDPV